VVVCFEAVEHVEEPDIALDELARVVTRVGVVALSSPNRDVYVEGNPHHRHEYVPDELESALRARFSHVRLVRQHDWLAAAIFDDLSFELGDGSVVDSAVVRKVTSSRRGTEQYTLALASNEPLATLPELVVLAGDVQVRRLAEQAGRAERAEQQVEALMVEGREREHVVEHLEQEARRAQRRAHEAHQRIQELDVAVAAEQAARAHAEAQTRQALAAEQAARLCAEEELATIMGTKTFRYTAPLRAGFARVRRGVRQGD
jgi:hypothetical protein